MKFEKQLISALLYVPRTSLNVVIIYLLVSHLVPLKPVAHLHVKPVVATVQAPLLAHGLGAQASVLSV